MAKSSRSRRTFFTKPLIRDSLAHLPAAVDYPDALDFRKYLEASLHQNSSKARWRYAKYIANRFSVNGRMNLDLARALSKFGDSPTGREILYFELLQSAPVLHEAASLWLAALPRTEQGSSRTALVSFLNERLGGRDADEVATAVVTAFKQCGKMISPKIGYYSPVWKEPPLEVFLYVLAKLYPEATMVRVDLFAGLPILRAMLWPRPDVDSLLRSAEREGHVSKISELDQYHQFTLAGSGSDRMERLLAQEQAMIPGEEAIR